LINGINFVREMLVTCAFLTAILPFWLYTMALQVGGLAFHLKRSHYLKGQRRNSLDVVSPLGFYSCHDMRLEEFLPKTVVIDIASD
jgi:hypothetical protein